MGSKHSNDLYIIGAELLNSDNDRSKRAYIGYNDSQEITWVSTNNKLLHFESKQLAFEWWKENRKSLRKESSILDLGSIAIKKLVYQDKMQLVF